MLAKRYIVNETQFIFGFLSFFAMCSGIGLLFVKIEESETNKISKLILMSSLFQYKWFKYFAALACFILSIITGLEALNIP